MVGVRKKTTIEVTRQGKRVVKVRFMRLEVKSQQCRSKLTKLFRRNKVGRLKVTRQGHFLLSTFRRKKVMRKKTTIKMTRQGKRVMKVRFMRLEVKSEQCRSTSTKLFRRKKTNKRAFL